MRRFLALALATMVLASLTACGGQTSTTGTDTDEVTQAETEAVTEFAQLEGMEGTVQSYYIKIVGTEAFTDGDGDDAVRVYYDFRNDSNDIVEPCTLEYIATENGTELDDAHVYNTHSCSVVNNTYLGIEPGYTSRCCSQFKYDPSGTTMTLKICDFWEESVQTFDIDLTDLTGAPSEWTPRAVSNPNFFGALTNKATFADGNDYEITNVEFVDSANEGETVMRVYYSLTNNGTEEISFTENTTCYAYQDGIALESGFAYSDVDEDWNYYEDVPAGETMTGAVVYKVRTDSPIEFLLRDYNSTEEYAGIGGVFSVNAEG